METKSINSPLTPLVAGATASLVVTVGLYPLDTLKTRVQSPQGFYKAGGFKGVYRGLLTVATSSVPTAALFYVTYETTKSLVGPLVPTTCLPLVYMSAASISEILACVIIVPTEIAKQRRQTYVGAEKRSSFQILTHAYRTEGLRNGLYRGFLSTVLRDLPFGFIELPLWEILKATVRNRNDGKITNFQTAMCGSLAAGIAGGATTPLDVAKTHIMLAKAAGSRMRVFPVLVSIYHAGGVRGLFKGVLLRTSGFTMGGFVFFGVYDKTKEFSGGYFDK